MSGDFVVYGSEKSQETISKLTTLIVHFVKAMEDTERVREFVVRALDVAYMTGRIDGGKQ